MDNAFDENELKIEFNPTKQPHIKEKVVYQRDEDGLLPKERLFVENLLRGKNQHEAALAAGYSENVSLKTTSNILKRKHILEYYHKRRGEAALAASIDSDWFIKMLVNEIKDPNTAKRDKAEFMKILQKAIGCEKTTTIVQTEVQDKQITINIGSVDIPKEEPKE